MIRITPKLQLAGSTFLAQALRVLTTLVMARFVKPGEYGMLTLVLSWPALIGAMGDFGIPTTLVQIRGEDERDIIDTGIVLDTLLYVLYGLMTVAGGVLLYRTRPDHDWRYVPLSAIMAASSLMGAIYSVQLATLNRRMHFTAESKQNMIFSVVQAATGIALAKAGFGVFALAFQTLSAQLVANVAIWRHEPLRWPHRFSMRLTKHYLSLGGKVSLALYVSNVQGSIVNLLIDHFSGQQLLGMWGRAVNIQQLFAQNLMQSIERVVYPLMCDAREDAVRLRGIFTKATIALLLFGCFSGAWLWAGSSELIRLMLGPGWEPVAPMLKILALAVPAGALYSIAYNACYAMGRTSWLLWASVVSLFLYVPLATASQYWWGVDGVAWSWVVSRYVISLLVIAWVVRLVLAPTGTLVGHAAALLGIGAVAAACIALLATHIPLTLPLLLRFAAMSAGGAAVYGLLVWLTQKEFVAFAIGIARGGKA